MGNRQTVTLIIISALTMLVTLIGASFAFFASYGKTNDTINLGAQSESGSPSFISMSSDSLDISVDAFLMQQAQVDNNNTVDELTDEASLSIYLNSPKNNEISTCSYDIILEMDENSDLYVKTEGADKEFTISGNATITNGKDAVKDDDSRKSQYIIDVKNIPEINIDELDWQEKTIANDKKVRYAILVDDAKISSLYFNKPTTVEWNFEVKFYNITKMQDELRGQKYSGVIKVDEKSIKC